MYLCTLCTCCLLHRWRLIHIRALNVLSYLNTCDKKKEKVVCICWHCTPRLFIYIFGNDFFINKISNVFLRGRPKIYNNHLTLEPFALFYFTSGPVCISIGLNHFELKKRNHRPYHHHEQEQQKLEVC